MTSTTKIALALAAVLFIALSAATATYLVMAQRMREAIADTKSAQDDKTIAALNQQISQSQAAMAKRDADFAESQKTLLAQIASVKTVQQAAPQIQQLAKLPDPVTIKPSEIPNAPSSMLIPGTDVLPLYKSLAMCDSQRQELGVCQTDKTDLAGQVTKAKAAQAEAESKAKTWETAAKGGSKLSRVWFALKVGGCGAAGAVPGAMSKNSGATVLGAASLSTACAIFLNK